MAGTWVSEVKKTYEVIDNIATALIGTTGGYWTDNDVTWTTTTKTGTSAHRSLKYTNGGETIYVAFEMENTSAITTWSGYQAKGLRIYISSGWAANAPSGTVYKTFLQFEQHTTTVNADLATLDINVSYWYEGNGNGIVLIGYPSANATDASQQSFFFCLERNASKEYADGYSNFFFYAITNIYNFHSTSYADSTRMKNYIRPFNFCTPEDTWSNYNYASGRTAGGATPGSIPYCAEDYGIKFPSIGENPVANMKVNKSTANGRVYFIKPIYMNSRDCRSPIAQSELFFTWNEGTGIADGDIITLNGVTKKYIFKSVTSPDSSTKLMFALKYYD